LARVRKAYPEDFEVVYPLFSGFAEPRPDKETFLRVFQPPWGNPLGHVGYLLEENKRVVGFLGIISSHRPLRDGKTCLFGNLTCWIVEPEYRSESLLLLLPLLRLPNMTLTNLTGNKVAPILNKFGFIPIDRYYQMVLPVAFSMNKLSIRMGEDAILHGVDHISLKVHNAHRGLFCKQVLFRTPMGDCYCLVANLKKKGRKVAQVHYASDTRVLRYALSRSALAICRSLGVVGIIVGEHFLDGKKIPFSLTIPQRQLRLFRPGPGITRDVMDTAYSELQLLGILSGI
jgi:hypothetical protein